MQTNIEHQDCSAGGNVTVILTLYGIPIFNTVKQWFSWWVKNWKWNFIHFISRPTCCPVVSPNRLSPKWFLAETSVAQLACRLNVRRPLQVCGQSVKLIQ